MWNPSSGRMPRGSGENHPISPSLQRHREDPFAIGPDEQGRIERRLAHGGQYSGGGVMNGSGFGPGSGRPLPVRRLIARTDMS